MRKTLSVLSGRQRKLPTSMVARRGRVCGPGENREGLKKYEQAVPTQPQGREAQPANGVDTIVITERGTRWGLD